MRLMFWALFATMSGVYLTMAFWSIPLIVADADGLMLFDLRPMGYSYAEAQTFLAALSDQGRDFYLNVQQRLDSAYPALMAVVLALAFKQLFRGWQRWAATAFGVAGAGFDYLENAAVAVMLRASDGGADGLTEAMVATASFWSVLKFATVSLAMTALIAGLVMAWLAKRKARS